MSIIADHISYVYSQGTAYEKYALKDISLKIDDGEFVAIIGHTGSGKSTLIQHFNGLLKATSGTIYYNGKDVYDEDFDLRDLRTHVGLVFQYPEHQLFESTVLEDVKFGPRNLGLPKLEIDMRAFEAIKMVGLSDTLYDASPFELSGGQKRRAAIAGVLAMKPDVIILDEPTAGLDPAGRDEILNLLRKMHNEGMTIILVSHSMEDVAEYADRLIVIDDGRIKYTGTPREVFANVEGLESIGLAVPEVTYAMRALRENGIHVGLSATTVSEAEAEIETALRRRGLL